MFSIYKISAVLVNGVEVTVSKKCFMRNFWLYWFGILIVCYTCNFQAKRHEELKCVLGIFRNFKTNYSKTQWNIFIFFS